MKQKTFILSLFFLIALIPFIPGNGIFNRLFIGFLIVLIGIVVSLVPPGESTNKVGFELRLIGGTVGSIALGLILYFRGARSKASEVR